MNNVSFNPTFKDIANYLFPIGSLYYTQDSNFNPNTHFGGSWVQIKDKFILACGDTYKINQTGGEATHTLTIDEMPNHNHKIAIDGTEVGVYGGAPTGGGNAYALGSTYKNLSSIGVGGGLAHNNMPPFETAYIWKRNA